MSLCYYFLSVICSIYSINSSKIIFKWSLPLTSMKFFTSSSFFNASVADIFLFSSSSVTISISKFLQFTNHHIRVEKTGKKGNSSVGLGLEYLQTIFYEDARVVTWIKNSFEKLDNELHVKVKKCVK